LKSADPKEADLFQVAGLNARRLFSLSLVPPSGRLSRVGELRDSFLRRRAPLFRSLDREQEAYQRGPCFAFRFKILLSLILEKKLDGAAQGRRKKALQIGPSLGTIVPCSLRALFGLSSGGSLPWASGTGFPSVPLWKSRQAGQNLLILSQQDLQ
jgi:hypothetical protein